jgi:phosphoribosylformylglycinamidine synthase subunit PurSL
MHCSPWEKGTVMLWEIEIEPKTCDRERERMNAEFALLTHQGSGNGGQGPVIRSTRGYLLDGIEQVAAEMLASELLVDPVVESAKLGTLSPDANAGRLTVLLKPGVMDPVAQSIVGAARDLGVDVTGVRTFRRYYTAGKLESSTRSALTSLLANDAIEQVVDGPLHLDHLTVGQPYVCRKIDVPVRRADAAELVEISRAGQLALSLDEMQSIQAHFRELGRDPTDIELETLAQTWSEHCSHKTLKGKIDFNGRRIDNLLKETIFGATQEIRRRLGSGDWCVSVFEDNAGVVQFDEQFHVCFKVETHNHPSAIEPYGGANTGLGGVIRDPLGTGLGARPICNTDVFCFAPPETPASGLPAGVIHPRRLMQGVVAGVRDYGNRIGIPTVNGAVCFDDRYLANPLVFCGTVGLIPVDRAVKKVCAGDYIVALGGRTGRDGIHGATFSSLELTAESETVSGGAVQIGNAITEKKVLDVLLEARDRRLYNAVTDCGAGGFSSAIGEMADGLGARVDLDEAPLKYEGLSYTEIWISEAQERMILAVPPPKWPALRDLCASEDVEATALGSFEQTGRLRLFYQGESVGDLDLHFLHHGRPAVVRKASWAPPPERPAPKIEDRGSFNTDLLRILASGNVCSKEWIVRQYDHEVQGGTVIKPLVGEREDGPGDAAVVTGGASASHLGVAVGCGINPRYGDLDPYWMAAAAVDEAVRNVVAVGADPGRVALLDNFCWGNTERPETLGSLVRAAEACRDAALALQMPFISGKDSLNNEYASDGRRIAIPPTLLISALGRVPDVRRAVTMDLKAAGNLLYLIGATRDELGGSHLHLVRGLEGGAVPRVDLERARGTFLQLHRAIATGLVRSCHDLSEGGLAVALAEMVFAGEIGADVKFSQSPGASVPDVVLLFSETPTRFVVEVEPMNSAAFEALWPHADSLRRLGQTIAEGVLRIQGESGQLRVVLSASEMKKAWKQTLAW